MRRKANTKRTRASKSVKKQHKIRMLREQEKASLYSKHEPARVDHFWRDLMNHENAGKFNSMVKGLEMN